jgi:hypothetical protein
MTTALKTPMLMSLDEESGSGFQWLLASMVEAREVPLDPDPHLHSEDQSETEAELDLRVSCF